MGKTRIGMALWTRARFNERAMGHLILESLSKHCPERFPGNKWGDVAEKTIVASPYEYSKLLDFWESSGKECGRTVYGSDSECTMLVTFGCGPSREPHSLHYDFSVDLEREQKLVESGLELFASCCNIMEADFGRMSTTGEWERKNVIRQYKKPDGGVNPWKVFAKNIANGMPGVYWATYMGKVFTDWIGEDILATSPWPYVNKYKTGFLLRRSDQVGDWESERSLDLGLLVHLGRARFFDIEHTDRRIEVPNIQNPHMPADYLDVTKRQDKLARKK